jgi:Lrp/AsnC family leucine-responsive transcriptional regulator
MSGGYDYLLRVVAADLDGYNRFLRNELLSLGCVDHVQTGFALQRVVDRTALPLDHLGRRARAPASARRTGGR